MAGKSQKSIGQVFACGRPKPPRCNGSVTCDKRTEQRCEFPLAGRLEGRPCGAHVCDAHSEVVDGKRLCDAHVRFTKRQAQREQKASVH